MSILQGELASEVAANLIDADVPYDIVVTRATEGDRDPYDPDGETTVTITEHVGKGWVEQYSDEARDGTLIDDRDVRVMILTSTIDIVPTDSTDSVTAEGSVFNIQSVHRDASGALHVVQARR